MPGIPVLPLPARCERHPRSVVSPAGCLVWGARELSLQRSPLVCLCRETFLPLLVSLLYHNRKCGGLLNISLGLFVPPKPRLCVEVRGFAAHFDTQNKCGEAKPPRTPP